MVAPINDVESISDINKHGCCPKKVSQNWSGFSNHITKILRREYEEDRVEICKAKVLSKEHTIRCEVTIKDYERN